MLRLGRYGVVNTNSPAFIGCADVVVDHLPGLVGNLKSHWLPHVLPGQRHTFRGVSVPGSSSILKTTRSQPRGLLSMGEIKR